MNTTINWPDLAKKLAPKAVSDAVEAFQYLPSTFEQASINTILCQTYFVALSLEETGGFTRLEENLGYSAKGLRKTFPKHFPTDADAAKYAYNQEAIANKAYGTRMGNKSPGDGWRFRGRGPFQLTGRANYATVGRLTKLPLEVQPELATSPRYMFTIAAAYWNMAGLSGYADADDLKGFTRIVNGGYIGMEARIKWLNMVKEAVNVELASAPA